jgi:hypothetical protein
MLFIHWIACAWYLGAFIDNFPEDCWVVTAGIRDADPTTQYIRSLYWAIVTMTTVGYYHSQSQYRVRIHYAGDAVRRVNLCLYYR